MQKKQSPLISYNYDLRDPGEFTRSPHLFRQDIEYPKWYDLKDREEYRGKLIYRYEKAIPAVV